MLEQAAPNARSVAPADLQEDLLGNLPYEQVSTGYPLCPKMALAQLCTTCWLSPALRSTFAREYAEGWVTSRPAVRQSVVGAAQGRAGVLLALAEASCSAWQPGSPASACSQPQREPCSQVRC